MYGVVHADVGTDAEEIMMQTLACPDFDADADVDSNVDADAHAHADADVDADAVSYTHLRAHETREDLVCRLLLHQVSF